MLTKYSANVIAMVTIANMLNAIGMVTIVVRSARHIILGKSIIRSANIISPRP